MEHQHSILYGPFNWVWHKLGFAWDVPDHVVMALLVFAICAVLLPLVSRSFSRDDPGHFQQFLEYIIGGLRNLLEDVVGHGSERYLDLIGALTVFIFISNIFGLFFFLQPPTANVNTTFGLAICAFLYYNFHGIRAQGPLHYLKHFGGPVWWLAPLMFPIELIGHFARILSLGVRLFGNIFGEHTATGIFVGLMPFVIPWPMMGLGIFGAVLQTFIFVMLTMVYIGGAVATEEH
ncbi:MAG: F0F1 ATP synthase subunit A [Thermoanaerobaculia bacterium]